MVGTAVSLDRRGPLPTPRFPIIVIALAVLAACDEGRRIDEAPDEASDAPAATPAGPTQTHALEVVRQYLQSLRARDYDSAVAMCVFTETESKTLGLSMSPDGLEQARKKAAKKAIYLANRMVEFEEGVRRLAALGTWWEGGQGRFIEPLVDSWSRLGIRPERMCGFDYEPKGSFDSELGFYWTGERLLIIHIEDVDRLGSAEFEDPK